MSESAPSVPTKGDEDFESDDSQFSDDDVPLFNSDEEDFQPTKKKVPAKKSKAKKKAPARKPTPKKKTPPKKAVPKKARQSAPPKIEHVSEDEEESDFDDDIPLSEVCANVIAVGTKRKRAHSSEPEKKRRKTAAERTEEEMPEFKWWREDAANRDPSIRWKTLEHNGVVFPPPYKPLPNDVKLLYDGKPVELPEEAEEAATFYATHLNATGIKHTDNPTFNKNFFADFLDILNAGKKKKDLHVITDLQKCDFNQIAEHLADQREKRKNRTKEEKDVEKEEKKELREKYGFAMVDGRKEKVGNFMAEPPGLFLGRGKHPKIGHIKKRIYPEDVTINISEDAPIPECPIEGHTWKDIVHDPKVTWLAFWRENINDSSKYVWLAPSSAIKGRADKKKFDVARSLKNYIDNIRRDYKRGLVDDHEPTRQMATAIYLIDRLALRVGNEKGSDEADTVGCCSLRVEHITCEPPDTLNFDFLGKDSMRYENSVEVPKKVFNNIKRFQRNKKPGAELFNLLSTMKLNNHLKKLMPGLTAKVFRTYNASITLQEELAKIDLEEFKTIDERVLFYNRANRQVAILCNHQRTLPKTHDTQMEKLDAKIQEIRDEIKELKNHLEMVKKGIDPPSPKQEDGDSPRKKIPRDKDKIKKKIATVRDRLHKWEIKKIEKDENKAFSTTTSKMNYLDPRITVAWCKQVDVDISRIFSKTIRQKFPWAMDTDDDFEW